MHCKPLGLAKYRLAKDIGAPAQRIGEVAYCKRAVTADTALRFWRYWGLSDGWCLRGQAACDTVIAKEALRKQPATIRSFHSWSLRESLYRSENHTLPVKPMVWAEGMKAE